MLQKRDYDIIEFIKSTGECSLKDIFNGISLSISYAALKRILANLSSENFYLIVI